MKALVMNGAAAFALMSLVVFGTSASASPETDALGVCLVDSLDGKERKRLARWMFFSMGAHPEIRPYLSANEEDVDSSDQYVGRLVTRLLADDCPAELKEANQQDPRAVEKAFGLVGEVAVQELATNEKVMDAITNYSRYADQRRISEALTAPESTPLPSGPVTAD